MKYNKKNTEMSYVILFNRTDHGKKYWRACDADDIVTMADTYYISEAFVCDENQSINDAFSNAFGQDLECFDEDLECAENDA